MERELNIAAILKEKPIYTHLHDIARNVTVLFQEIDEYGNIICSLNDGLILKYENTGRMHSYPTGMKVLMPSKEMQDWSKFAWKKGDVLGFSDIVVIFEKWTKDDYTEFKASYEFVCHSGSFDKGNVYYTSEFCKAIDEVADNFIKEIEEHYGGKLNLSTLQIEKPKQEFKDGDVVTAKFYDDKTEMICIFKEKDDEFYMGYCGVFSTGELKGRIILDFEEDCIGEDNECNLRIATNSEKQQLFDALSKENKAWDAEKKMLVDLPKKCEFKPMDWCLMRDIKEKWKLCQFGFCDKEDEYEASYNAVGGNWYNECIPYNNSTKHLLGTTDEWKGGEG